MGNLKGVVQYGRSATAAGLMVMFLIVALVMSGPASAHAGHELGEGFVSGFMHPILGWDHLVAMVAVGLWGAFLGVPAIWLLPVTFPLVMAVGGAAGVIGVPMPFVEPGIAISSIVLGLLIAFGLRLPLAAAGIIVGLFAVFHGHAHGAELPEAADPLAYAVGFVIATGLLHLVGIAFGMLARWPAGYRTVRAGGGVIAVVGIIYLLAQV